MRRVSSVVAVLLAIVAGGVGAGGWWAAEREGGRWPIVIQQANGNLLLADEAGLSRPLTTDADGQNLAYWFVTPAPDGRSVATVAVRNPKTAPTTALVVRSLNGMRATLFEQADARPFYLAWSPDSRKIAFLASTPQGMALNAVAIDGNEPARQIAPGQPNYFAWAPDSRRLLLHIGGGAPNGSLKLYEWGDPAPRPLATPPGFFQAPGWLDAQRGLIVTQQPDGALLAAIDDQGSIVQQVARVSDATLFVMSPSRRNIAYLSFNGSLPGQVHILRADGSGDQAFDPAPALTFFWSPAGDRLAYLTQAPSANGAQTRPTLRWNVVTLKDLSIRSYEPFAPTDEFISLLPYFDQYAQSVRLWDRSGTRLLYATPSGIYTLDVTTALTKKVNDGVVAFWMDR